MYIDSIELVNFRNFRKTTVEFVHLGSNRRRSSSEQPPRLPNVNLLLGNNGLGKTSLLRGIALAAMGPAVGDSGIYAYRLVRREPGPTPQPNGAGAGSDEAVINARFTPHAQDQLPPGFRLESRVSVTRKGDLEQLRWSHPDEKPWHPIFSAETDAFFFVGYGATRRVERRESMDLGSRKSSAFARAQRVKGLFEDSYSLIPLTAWLPQLKAENPGRHTQVVSLVNRLMGKGHYSFAGEMESGEYVFGRGGLRIPFPALSDGYQAFLGWVGDLLYHVCSTCPSGKRLVENHGIVMVDEIDLHLHPRWQMEVVPRLAKELPNLQFIVTSHSPLIVGSLEWMNILVMTPARNQASSVRRFKQGVHGLDADQVLISEFFGLESTRASGKQRRLKKLTLQARDGDAEAAKTLLVEMAGGMESSS